MSDIATAGRLACFSIYDPIEPNVFDELFHVGETTCGIKLIDGVLWVTCQGTENAAGWEADVDLVPTYHQTLGNLHTGFYQNLPALITQLAPHIAVGVPIIACGHSKGAGEASILGAILKLAGYSVIKSILFACPNSMYQRGAEWLANNISGISIRNGIDPVPMVPLEPYYPPYQHTSIFVQPGGWHDVIPTDWHAASLYNQWAQTQ